MRDAKREELESVKKHIESISKPTGVNFFAILENGSTIKSLESKQSIKRGQRARLYPLDGKCNLEFLPQFLGDFVPQIDCNDCRWLDLTEDEQQELGDKCHRNHFCTYYKKRVYHETNNLIHNPELAPCKECEKEKHEHYQNKNRE